MNCKNSAVAYLFNSNVLSTGWFLGPRGPIVLPSVGPVLSSVQEFLLLFIPSYPSPPTSVSTTVTLVTPPVTPVVVVVVVFVVIVDFVFVIVSVFVFVFVFAVVVIVVVVVVVLANDHLEYPASCK